MTFLIAETTLQSSDNMPKDEKSVGLELAEGENGKAQATWISLSR